MKFISIAICLFIGASSLGADVVQPAAPTYVPPGLNWVVPTNAFFGGPFVFVNDGRGWQPGLGTQDSGEVWNDLGSQDPNLGILGLVPGLWTGGYLDQNDSRIPPRSGDPCNGPIVTVTSNLGANQSQSTSHFLMGSEDCRVDVSFTPYVPPPPPPPPPIQPEKPGEPEIPEQPIPEPATFVLFGAGIGLITYRSRRRKI